MMGEMAEGQEGIGQRHGDVEDYQLWMARESE